MTAVVLNRWGRVLGSAGGRGSFLFVEPETREPGFSAPPAGALRVWHRRPGVADDDDANWTLWLVGDQIEDWLTPAGFDIEWLDEGVEPDWSMSM